MAVSDYTSTGPDENNAFLNRNRIMYKRRIETDGKLSLILRDPSSHKRSLYTGHRAPKISMTLKILRSFRLFLPYMFNRI